MKLGKLTPRIDHRTLKLAKYVQQLPPAPEAVDWSGKMVFPAGMMQNDVIGDCTCAAAGHMIQIWTSNTTTELTIPDSDIVAAYATVSGYSPTDPSTDTGAVELDVLRYWRNTGIGGHQITAFASVNPRNIMEVAQAVNLFGGLYVGLALPRSAQDQPIWTHTIGDDSAAGSWGGHAVCVVSYDQSGPTCITWGNRQRMDWNFWHWYCDEAYAVLSPEWISGTGSAPSGFDMEQLRADLGALE